MHDTDILSDFHAGAFSAAVALKCHGEEYMLNRFEELSAHFGEDYRAGYRFVIELPR